MTRTTIDFAAAARRPAGIDEVGRGPLAGPVVAAAVILPETGIEGIRDSKKLTAGRRAELDAEIRASAVGWAIGRAGIDEIDRLNIFQASLLAMQRAVEALRPAPDYAWVDGRHCPVLQCPVEAIVGGDGLIPAIGAASIIAKQARDAEMIALAERFPGYGFEQHKGYGTRQHLDALRRLGPSPVHRRSFRPVRDWS